MINYVKNNFMCFICDFSLEEAILTPDGDDVNLVTANETALAANSQGLILSVVPQCSISYKFFGCTSRQRIETKNVIITEAYM